MSAALILSGPSWSALREQALILQKSGFLPEAIRTPEQAIAIAIKGHEVGFPIMQAFSHIHIINRKPGISAEGQLCLIYKNCPSAWIHIQPTDTECRISAARSPKHPVTEITFTLADAEKAGLMGNTSWKKYPRAMLRSRAVSEIARTVFPDAIAGLSYTPEELGAEVNEEGEVISVEPIKKESPPKKEITQAPKEPDKYDPDDVKHRFSLWEIAKRFGVTEIDALKELNSEMKDVEMETLNLSVQKYLIDAGVIEPEPNLEGKDADL